LCGDQLKFDDISDTEFAQFQDLIHRLAGITLTPAKKYLVVARLSSRLRELNCEDFGQYHRHVTSPSGAQELQNMVNLLTTNETSFFREQKHFDFLAERATKEVASAKPFRVWSAASSTGEEAYSIAMVLAETLGSGPWEVVGTDISTRVLEHAGLGKYAADRAEQIPAVWLNKYWSKNSDAKPYTIQATTQLRERVTFLHMNLHGDWPNLGQFDVIFLRNVMIYFDMPTKARLIQRVTGQLSETGYLFVGHSESLYSPGVLFKTVVPAVFQRK